ncbi:MAG: NAD(P)H-binding protein [Anaerolineales bacterium]|nr:NAD(P)H-binding protein [Anaerolineales bacterium]
MPSIILVTGATGYIASLLIPKLLERGYQVRALARQPERLKARAWFKQVEMVQGDVTDPASLAPALMGIHAAYYLIHNMASGHGYTSIELEGARNFASAAEQAGVEHIIYLGGLADPEQHIAPHMRSRIETGMTLRQGPVPVTEFRAGVIVGSGSISFEMIRFMTELFPIVPGPAWLKNKSNPIASQNVVDYLLAALTNPNGRGRVFEIGMKDTFTYQELMKRYAELRGHKRVFVLIPFIPIWFMAFGIDLMTPVQRRIAYALVGGLSSDSIVLHDEARETFPEVRLMEYEPAVAEAMRRLHPLKIERVWEDGSSGVKFLKHEGFFIEHREKRVDVNEEAIAATLSALGYEQAGEGLYLQKLPSRFGEAWVEWRASNSRLEQTAYFAPRGMGGFLFWWLSFPFRALKLKTLLDGLAKKAVVQ